MSIHAHTKKLCLYPKPTPLKNENICVFGYGFFAQDFFGCECDIERTYNLKIILSRSSAEMNHFNEVATDILKRHNCEFSVPNLRLYESEIDISTNKLKPFLRSIKNLNNKDWIILEVSFKFQMILWIKSLFALFKLLKVSISRVADKIVYRKLQALPHLQWYRSGKVNSSWSNSIRWSA